VGGARADPRGGHRARQRRARPVGQAAALLGLAGAAEGRGRDADALAYFREAVEFRNALLCELPRGDFAVTMVRQFLFDAYDVLLTEALQASAHAELAGVMAKAHKEARYHVRHSATGWCASATARPRATRARRPRSTSCGATRPSCSSPTPSTAAMLAAGVGADLDALRPSGRPRVREVLAEATLRAAGRRLRGARRAQGRHTEHLGAHARRDADRRALAPGRDVVTAGTRGGPATRARAGGAGAPPGRRLGRGAGHGRRTTRSPGARRPGEPPTREAVWAALEGCPTPRCR
jgi:ring-1,2-phenylacetyl-CoA epoxidase subunit PaaC